jgi:hypothetical protein
LDSESPEKTRESSELNTSRTASAAARRPPARPVRFVRAIEVASVTRVSTEQEWEQLNKKLDQRVRQLLDEGYDVELG